MRAVHHDGTASAGTPDAPSLRRDAAGSRVAAVRGVRVRTPAVVVRPGAGRVVRAPAPSCRDREASRGVVGVPRPALARGVADRGAEARAAAERSAVRRGVVARGAAARGVVARPSPSPPAARRPGAARPGVRRPVACWSAGRPPAGRGALRRARPSSLMPTSVLRRRGCDVADDLAVREPHERGGRVLNHAQPGCMVRQRVRRRCRVDLGEQRLLLLGQL